LISLLNIPRAIIPGRTLILFPVSLTMSDRVQNPPSFRRAATQAPAMMGAQGIHGISNTQIPSTQVPNMPNMPGSPGSQGPSQELQGLDR
jgi:hypothetical protein